MPPGVLLIFQRLTDACAAFTVPGDPFAEGSSPHFPIPGHVQTAFPLPTGCLPSPG